MSTEPLVLTDPHLPSGQPVQPHSERPTPQWAVWLHGVRPVRELVSLAQHAEQQGASAFLLADEGVDRDIYVTLTAVALSTSRLTLITAITNPHSRHPVATAAAFASLAEVAPGRVVAGLGAGGSLVFGPMGLRPPRPYTALAETVEVVDALLDGQTVTHQGEFNAVGARLSWAPGRLPLAIAGRGPRVEALGATRADWVVLSGKPVADLPDLVAQLRSRPDGGPRLAWNPAIAWTEDQLLAVRARFAFMTVDMPAAWRERLGVGDEVVDLLRRTVAQGGPESAAHLVPQAVVDEFAITGTRDHVVRRLADIAAQIQPEVVTFGVNEYTTAHIDEIAAIATEAGLVSITTPPRKEGR